MRADAGVRVSRVLLVEANVDGTIGGSHRCLLDLVRHMDRSRFEPTVLFYQGNAVVRAIRDLGVPAIVWDETRPRKGQPAMARRSLEALAVVRRFRFLLGEGIDLVHLNNAPGIGFADWLPAARLLRIPCVTHVRGLGPYPTSRLGRFLFKRYDALIAISRHVRQDLVDHGVAGDVIHQVYDGIDHAELARGVRREAQRIRRDLGIRSDEFLCLMAGNLQRWKGQHVLLRALGQLVPAVRERVRAIFAGQASSDALDYRAELERVVGEERLGDRVEFLGYREDIADLMSAADCVVHASTDPEPFGLVVLEAMSLGKPVIAAHHGGPAEVITPGTGLLFDPRSSAELARCLSRLFADAALRDALGRAASRRAREFDVEQTVRGVETVYLRLVGGAGTGVRSREDVNAASGVSPRSGVDARKPW